MNRDEYYEMKARAPAVPNLRYRSARDELMAGAMETTRAEAPSTESRIQQMELTTDE